LIAVSGEDAASFLQNQLTNDVQTLSAGEARLAGLCSTKGRLLATFLCWKDDRAVYLECARELQDSVQKHLSRFVLRAKARLTDAGGSFKLYGLTGDSGRAFLEARFDVPERVWDKRESAAGTVIRVPDSMGYSRWQWIAPTASAGSEVASASSQLGYADSSFWRWLEIRAGLPQITLTTQDRFVPQMLNFEALGGVSFKKGCYPGQEVVARSQYLGKLKRRMTVATVTAVARSAGQPDAANPLPGTDVMAASTDQAERTEAVGTVVNAEPSPAGGLDLLVELPIATIGSADPSIALTTAAGDRLELLPLPYLLPDQEVFIRPKL
jgi:hypothetical protein